MGVGKRLTTQEFKDKIYKKYNGKVEIIGEFLGGQKPIEFIYHCEKHGDTTKSINAKNISSNKTFQPCKECEIENKRNSNGTSRKPNDLYNEFKLHIISKGGTLLTKTWNKSKATYDIKCNNPNHPVFSNTHDKIMNSNQWCPYCCGRKGEFNDRYKSIVESKGGILLSEYNGIYAHVKVKCIKHDWVWEIMPSNIEKGRWCPICSLPNSEIAVFDFLRNYNYNFDIQHQFDNLVSDQGAKLKFDFSILDKFGNLLCLIESDGESHRNNSNPNNRNYNTFLTDKLKEEFCIKNNIRLFRVIFKNSDWDYNMHYKYLEENLLPKLNSNLY